MFIAVQNPACLNGVDHRVFAGVYLSLLTGDLTLPLLAAVARPLFTESREDVFSEVRQESFKDDPFREQNG